MSHPFLLSLALSFLALAPSAKADPSCSDYPAFLQCVKQKQGTWQDCRQWHCEGGTSLRADELAVDAQASGRCDPAGYSCVYRKGSGYPVQCVGIGPSGRQEMIWSMSISGEQTLESIMALCEASCPRAAAGRCR